MCASKPLGRAIVLAAEIRDLYVRQCQIATRLNAAIESDALALICALLGV